MRAVIIFILAMAAVPASSGGVPAEAGQQPQDSGHYPRDPVLQGYIQEGLESNQGLKQKQLDYSMHMAALKEARGLFFPDLSVNARYTVAEGGRIIEFPVGDLLNPVYSTLNVLTSSDLFPQIENETFPFYRPTEHETKLSLVQPIFKSDILHNYRIEKQQVEIARIGVDQYRRELIRQISKAYYDYRKAVNLLNLADTTLYLVKENLRVSNSLYENDRVTIDAVYRSESELSKVEAQRSNAKNMVEAARAYFNFLLNRDLGTTVEEGNAVPVPLQVSLEQASEQALERREELDQIEAYMKLNEHVIDLHRGQNIPGIFGAVDYGFQGEEYNFTKDDDFLLASVVLQWTLFQGTVNRQKVHQSRIEGEKLYEMYQQTRQQIRLEVINHYYALHAAFESLEAARKQTRSARQAYRLIERKYKEGQANLLELIDARTSLTGAVANLIIARTEYFSHWADFEYATGVQVPYN